MNCAVCHERTASTGVLCEECRDDVSAPLGLLPEQILATIPRRTDAALIDQWGRPHPLEAITMIGRTIDRTGIQILEGSISRHHAHLTRDAASDSWTLTDLGSANGTFVNEQPITGTVPIAHGDRIAVGQTDFYFVRDAEALPAVEVDASIVTTVQPIDRQRMRELPGLDDPTTEQPLGQVDDFGGGDDTDVGLPSIEMRLLEPTGGGGGILEVGGLSVQLTAIQLELVSLLVRRMIEETTQVAQVRGFVRTSELLGRLSWDSRDPDDNHAKQLVRRVRKLLVRTGIGDLVEARKRFGYRLRVVPILR